MEGYNPMYDILTLGIPVAGIAAYLAINWLQTKCEKKNGGKA